MGRRNEIKDCIAAADMDNAVKRLIDFVRDFIPEIENDTLLLMAYLQALPKRI